MNKQLIAVARTILSLLPLVAIAETSFGFGQLEDITPEAYHNWDVLYEGDLLDIVSEMNQTLVTTNPVWKVISSEPMDLQINKFVAGTCTQYIAARRPELFMDDLGNRLIHGNAKDWFLQAKKLGFATGKTPKVGSIAVFEPGRGALSQGHVAYVEYVGYNGSIIVSDMNFKQKGVVTQRIIPESKAMGYIY